MDINEQRARILAELTAITEPPALRPWQFTVYQFAQAAGINRNQARTRLDALVLAGVLRSEMVQLRGKNTRAYWRPGDEATYL